MMLMVRKNWVLISWLVFLVFFFFSLTNKNVKAEEITYAENVVEATSDVSEVTDKKNSTENETTEGVTTEVFSPQKKTKYGF